MQRNVLWAFVGIASVLVGCAAEDVGADSESSDETGGSEADEVMSDDGLGASADAITGTAEAGSSATTTARVNLRTGPSTQADVIRVLPRGTSVTLVTGEPSGGFYEVTVGGDEGWVHGAYLMQGSSNRGGSNEDIGDASNTGRRVSTRMVYLGSCEFLGKCDSYSKSAWRQSPGTVVLGCGGRQSCDDGSPFISVPRGGPACDTVVRICRTSDPSRCVNARVKERSDGNQKYEANPAVAEALGWEPHDRYYNPAGGESTCSSSLEGDARVSIRW